MFSRGQTGKNYYYGSGGGYPSTNWRTTNQKKWASPWGGSQTSNQVGYNYQSPGAMAGGASYRPYPTPSSSTMGYRPGGGISSSPGGLGNRYQGLTGSTSTHTMSSAQANQAKMNELMNWYQPLQQIFGNNPEFSSAMQRAAAKLMDPLYYRTEFNPSSMFLSELGLEKYGGY